MKVRLVIVDHAAGLIDPVTRRSPFIDPDTKQVRLEADVAETSFWLRRIADGSIARATSQPTGREPVLPLTTRS